MTWKKKKRRKKCRKKKNFFFLIESIIYICIYFLLWQFQASVHVISHFINLLLPKNSNKTAVQLNKHRTLMWTNKVSRSCYVSNIVLPWTQFFLVLPHVFACSSLFQSARPPCRRSEGCRQQTHFLLSHDNQSVSQHAAVQGLSLNKL